jgi:release factor glutamine methyltransferase
MSGSPYISSEDSALLRRALEGRSGDACLEIGAGNGGTLAELSKRFKTVAGTDLFRPGMADWQDGASYVLSDLASCFRDEAFDLVAFNPPYVRGDGTGDRAVDGGRGLEVPLEFLTEALRTVRKDGSVVFLLNQDADLAEFEEVCERRGFMIRAVTSQRLFFEVLSVYEAVSAEGVAQPGGGSADAGAGHWETSTARRLHQVPASPS